MTTIQERVEAGAKWLDANRPGWVDRINLETLDLGDDCNCTLGQLFGDWLERPDEVIGQEFGFGFQRDESLDPRADGVGWEDWDTYVARVGNEYTALTDAWRDHIVERRAAVLPHGAPHCSCVIPCETCGADTVSGYLSGCEECSERRQCAYDRAEFGDVPAILPGGAA